MDRAGGARTAYRDTQRPVGIEGRLGDTVVPEHLGGDLFEGEAEHLRFLERELTEGHRAGTDEVASRSPVASIAEVRATRLR